MHQQIIAVQISKIFSLNNKMFQVMNFDELEQVMQHMKSKNYSWSRTVEPSLLLILSNKENLQRFLKITNSYMRMSTFSWFVFMKNKTGIDCDHPRGNPFNLEMDTDFIVRCENNMSIKKYYSITNNVTEVIDLGVLRPSNGSFVSNATNLIGVRKDMKGVTLRIAQVCNVYVESI